MNNQHSDDAWLLALGAAVSDGDGVDWDGAERSAATAEQRRLIQDLRRLSAVVDAHRDVPDDPALPVPERGTSPAPAAQVTHWRHLVLFERIGEGAFGTVHRGWDPVLDRDVAVKLLAAPKPGATTSPLDEARHLARVRHSNVVVVHGADEDAGTVGIWMEYIEGQTLARIVADRGPMSGREVAGIGLDLCGALSAIHAAGLLHRDIKAQNVMREVGGRIVLMDFSGAHAVRGDATRQLSGTPLYMAPELLNGASPTPATDVYSLGVLLFFLLSGRLPVEVPTIEELKAAHAGDERRRLRDLRPDLPEGIVQVIERATAPGVADRFRTAGQLEHALVHASGAQTAATAPLPPAAAPVRRGRRIAIGAAAILLGTVGAVLGLRQAAPQAEVLPPVVTRFTVGPPFVGGSWPRVSPDGRLVVFGTWIEGRQRFWVRPLDRLSGYALPHGTANETPFWSPDSTRLAYFEDGKLKKMPVAGGEPQVLADAPRPRGGDWHGNTILYGREDGIYRLTLGGGEPERVTTVDETLEDQQHGWPEFLPDGRRFLYLVRSALPERGGVYIGSLDGEPHRRLMDPFSRVAYADGRLVYVHDGLLVAHPFDPRRAVFNGEAVVLAGHVRHHAGSDASFDVSSTGVLIYSVLPGQPSSRLVLYDRRGRELQALTEAGWFGRPRFSPDGQRIVAERVSPEDNNADLWVFGLTPRSAMRLTTHPAPDVHPVWSPDGKRVAFSSRRGAVWDVFVKTVDAKDDEQLLFSLPGDKFVEHWSPDGRFVTGTLRHSGLWMVPLASSPPQRIRASESALHWQSEFSPDGRWLAYMSSESGQPEVYVEPVPATGQRWQVSTGGGSEPRWRADGKELLYIDERWMLTAVRLNGPGWHPSPPHALFRLELSDVPGTSYYTVSPDGRYVVVNTFVSDPLVPPIEVVVNWTRLDAFVPMSARLR